jgi:preprotein translocase subunit SecE
MNKFIQYLKDVRAEVAKVSWPTQTEVKGATVLVIVFSIVAALYVFACDQGLQAAVSVLLTR